MTDLATLILSLVLSLSPQAAPAPSGELPQFGVTGFSAYTPEPVILDRTPPPSASRDHVRENPPAPERVERVEVVAEPPVVEPPTPAPMAGGLLGIAAQYVGGPYVYGGSTPAGFDCSGYTSWVFGQVGISLPRTAAAQQASSTPVVNPQPGDLVFYGSPAWHVGIYAGNGMLYDAQNPASGVRYGPVYDDLYTVTYGRP